jgi:hypothetical protein
MSLNTIKDEYDKRLKTTKEDYDKKIKIYKDSFETFTTNYKKINLNRLLNSDTANSYWFIHFESKGGSGIKIMNQKHSYFSIGEAIRYIKLINKSNLVILTNFIKIKEETYLDWKYN